MITGRIYKLTSPNTDMVYIGSTTETLNRRLNQHIYDWEKKRKDNSSIYILEKGDYKIELIEEVQVDSIRDLRKLEQEYIDKIPNTINKVRAYISEEEKIEYNKTREKKYREKNKDKIIKHKQKYREKNKEIINKRNREIKEYCKACDCWVKGSGMIGRHERTPKHIRNFILS